MEELLIIAHSKDHQYNEGQDIRDISSRPLGEFEPFPGIRLRQELFPPPTPSGGAEEQIDQAAQGEQIIGYDKILQILNIAHGRGESAPDVEPQHTGQGQQDQGDPIDHDSLFPAPAQVHGKGDDVLKHRNDGGQRRKGHEQKKEPAPYAAQRHLVEDVGQRDKDQPHTLTGVDAEGKAGGEDDQARDEGHKGIQHTDADGLSGEGPLLADVAAEDGQGADAQAQGEECLAHGVVDRRAQNKSAVRVICQVMEIGH